MVSIPSRIVRAWVFLLVLSLSSFTFSDELPITSPKHRSFKLSIEHLAALNRPRRIVVNHQADGLLKCVQQGMTIDQIMQYEFGFADEPNTHIDGQWWSLDNTFPMKIRPLIDETSPSVPSYVSKEGIKVFKKWASEGTNLLEIYVAETKKRDQECFYSYRINEDPYTEHRELAASHPDWLIEGEWNQPLWNFAVPGVRQFKTSLLRELAEEYELDGIEVDFARGPVLVSPGHQWTQRDHITSFLRMVRRETLKAETRRGQSVLLAARIPDTLSGCHFDGLDIRTWIQENLVDILVLGVRSYELDFTKFQALVDDKPIKLYGTLDDHHCTDGYCWPPIEVWRGVVANWWAQGMTSLQTFNWGVASPEIAARYNLRFFGAYHEGGPRIPVYQQAYHELGDPDALIFLDKHFVVQRRGSGGSGGAAVENWTTPRVTYQNTNMLSQLPATLDSAGKSDVLIRMYVADDLAKYASRIDSLSLRVLLSDPATKGVPDDQKVRPAPINPFWNQVKAFTSPPRKDLVHRLQLRVNNILLPTSTTDHGWFVFQAHPHQFSPSENLVGLLITGRELQTAPITVEKIELHVDYGDP